MLASDIAQILKRNPKIFRSFASFFSVWDFMVGLAKLQLHAKFEVAGFNCSTNIKGQPQNFWELLYITATSIFS